jgi:transcriptional regulator with XRE-family HTH domain
LGYSKLGYIIYVMKRDQRYELLQQSLLKTRLKLGLTQEEVAIRLGKPQSFISKYESGERRLDLIEFLDICRVLATPPGGILKKLQIKDW